MQVVDIIDIILDYNTWCTVEDIEISIELEEEIQQEQQLIEGWYRDPAIIDPENWDCFYSRSKDLWYPPLLEEVLVLGVQESIVVQFTCKLLDFQDLTCDCIICEKARGNLDPGCSVYQFYYRKLRKKVDEYLIRGKVYFPSRADDYYIFAEPGYM